MAVIHFSAIHFFVFVSPPDQSALAVPSEDGIDLFSATQYSQGTHMAAAAIIDKPLNL